MGAHKNGRVYNVVSWITVAVLVVLTGAYVLSFVG